MKEEQYIRKWMKGRCNEAEMYEVNMERIFWEHSHTLQGGFTESSKVSEMIMNVWREEGCFPIVGRRFRHDKNRERVKSEAL